MSQRSIHIAQILWPAFLLAGVLEIAVFSWVDPAWFYWGDWHPDPTTTYSLMFLVFWVAVSLGAFLTHRLMQQPAQTHAI